MTEENEILTNAARALTTVLIFLGDGAFAAAQSDRIRSLPASQQAAVLGRVVGEGCTGTQAFYQGLIDGRAFWSVRCTNGRAYQVVISPDAGGSTRILECGSAIGFATTCFMRF